MIRPRSEIRVSPTHLAHALDMRFGELAAPDVVAIAASRFKGRIALVSSFGADAAVLLRMVSLVDPSLPVIFLDTGQHFGETLRHRDALVQRLALTDVRSVGPRPLEVVREDPHASLFARDPDACCAMRKVRPLAEALEGFDAWVTGRRRDQSFLRSELRAFEPDGRRVKVNPLAAWRQDEVDAYLFAHELPSHPLRSDGYASIGCAPCTSPVANGEDGRAGRWRGSAKLECGIHLN